MQSEWFESWFDSPYYDLLYEHRDDTEAAHFIDNLFSFLKPEPQSRILDLACGTGRHSVYIHSKGFQVTGLDLSEKMIRKENGPEFYIHDMRRVFRVNYYDMICSFFTSFGYFENKHDNIRMLRSVTSGLKEKGIFMLDYLNPVIVKEKLVENEVKEVKGWHVQIERKIVQERVVKTMRWEQNDELHQFEEVVSLFDRDELESMLQKSDLRVLHVFGDYNLDSYKADSSKRMIIVAMK